MQENRNASEQLTIEFSEIGSGKYIGITKSIVSEFGLEAIGTRINGLDEQFQDFKRSEFILGLEWDTWSGYMIVAKTTSSESLAREIADFILLNS